MTEILKLLDEMKCRFKILADDDAQIYALETQYEQLERAFRKCLPILSDVVKWCHCEVSDYKEKNILKEILEILSGEAKK